MFNIIQTLPNYFTRELLPNIISSEAALHFNVKSVAAIFGGKLFGGSVLLASAAPVQTTSLNTNLSSEDRAVICAVYADSKSRILISALNRKHGNSLVCMSVKCNLQTGTSNRGRPLPPSEAENTAVDKTDASAELSSFHNSPFIHNTKQQSLSSTSVFFPLISFTQFYMDILR